jgi:hypothetical protein
MIGVLCLAAATMGRSAAAGDARAEPTVEQVEFFEKQVRPVLVEHCYECHSGEAKRLEAGLRLDSRAAALAGGDSGPAVVPGKPDESPLIQAMRYESFEMPPRGRLPDETIQALAKWIEMGAPWPGKPDDALVRQTMDWRQRKAEHWSWQPIGAHVPPAVSDAAWPANPIDRFVLARLEASGLAPAPPADRRTLIRRLFFDLTGLPPSAEQVEAFAADDSPEAVERIVDQLLDSPHFGEKWARHWMDLVRYAETHGHEFDYPIHHAWRYRDYLIRAFNADVPYDQLLLEHLAGDLLPHPRSHPSEGFNESVIGTGFWFLGEAVHAPTDVRGDEAIRIDNQIDVMTKTFLGLTVACARCHDHKFDPIPTQDYYALTGFLQSSRRHEAMLDPHGKIAAASDRLRTLRRAGDETLAGAIDKTALDADRFAAGLLAAREAIAGLPADAEELPAEAVLNAAGQRHGLSGEQVGRWVTALRDPAIRDPSHPLMAWSRLASAASSGEQASMADARRRLTAELAAQAKQAETHNGQTVLFEDFESPASDRGWFVTGEAFDSQPTGARQWDASSRADLPAPAGLMHSGLSSNRLHGVLRSPTFTITHPTIHYRLNAKNATVRLVIDGYFMVRFHGLLFGGIEMKDVDTGGQFVWKTQAGDLRRYVGHSAHIEIIDQGDGFAAVDEIRFSDGPAPRDPPSRLARQALDDADADSIEALARSCAAIWMQCVQRWRQGTADHEQTALLAWATGHRLVLPTPATAEISQRMPEIESGLPAPVYALALTEGSGEDDRVHIRGSHKNLGEPVARRMLVAVGGEDQSPVGQGSGRLELAQRILDPANPFPARVMVNRLWHQLFGRGIVPSVDDFGVMGQRPTHPELLDWLAADFQQHGWSIKHTIRRIVTSSTYRMSSNPPVEDGRAAEIDPDNQLLHRMNKRRLQAEAIRDAMLAVSGRLDRTLHGASVPVHLTSFMEGRGRPGSGPLDGNGRRSVYVEIRRNFLSPMMLAFDMPSPFSTMGRRSVSNVPAQSLILMNDPFVQSQASLWAERMLREHDTADARIAAMFLAALGQPPTPAQLDLARQFLDSQAQLYAAAADDVRVWTDLAHTLFNMKEFVFLN